MSLIIHDGNSRAYDATMIYLRPQSQKGLGAAAMQGSYSLATQARGNVSLLLLIVLACLHPLCKCTSIPFVPFWIPPLPQHSDLATPEKSQHTHFSQGHHLRRLLQGCKLCVASKLCQQKGIRHVRATCHEQSGQRRNPGPRMSIS